MELGQTQSAFDLIPGSVSDVRATAEEWKARSDEAARVRDDLATVDDDGTWKGAAYEVYLDRFERQLLHFAIERYGPQSTQWQFDEAVRTGTPAHARLDGEDIVITRVETEVVP